MQSPSYNDVVSYHPIPPSHKCGHTLKCGIVAEAVLRLGHADGQLVKAHARIPVQCGQEKCGQGGYRPDVSGTVRCYVLMCELGYIRSPGGGSGCIVANTGSKKLPRQGTMKECCIEAVVQGHPRRPPDPRDVPPPPIPQPRECLAPAPHALRHRHPFRSPLPPPSNMMIPPPCLPLAI